MIIEICCRLKHLHLPETNPLNMESTISKSYLSPCNKNSLSPTGLPCFFKRFWAMNFLKRFWAANFLKRFWATNFLKRFWATNFLKRFWAMNFLSETCEPLYTKYFVAANGCASRYSCRIFIYDHLMSS